MVKVYVVSCNNKKIYCKSDDDIDVDTLVVIDTEHGEQIGKVIKLFDKDIKETSNILRIASVEDYDNYLDNLKDSSLALKKSRGIVEELGLEMKIVSANFNLDRSQLLFNFTADGRVDFRELAKRLAGIYHTRIELRQIGARDKAKIVGGVGVCGRELCCVKFLNSINTISMNMAKDQNLALNPSKINGSCGRLLCCLQYEDETYLECAKNLPKVGDKLDIGGKEGQVISIDILNKKGKILVDGERIDYEFDC